MDYRDVAACTSKWYRRFDERRMVVMVELPCEDEGGEDEYEEVEEVEVRVKYEVCPTCNGVGRYTNPAIDAHGISEEEWTYEWSDEEREAYLNGGYDIACMTCGGDRVTLVVDEHANSPEIVQRVNDSIAEYRAYGRERAHEIEMNY